jgi:hypothetical protein
MPKRPSAEDPAALAQKFIGRQRRLSIRVDEETLREIGKTAVLSDERTIKRFVLTACQEKGAKIAPVDLADDGDR